MTGRQVFNDGERKTGSKTILRRKIPVLITIVVVLSFETFLYYMKFMCCINHSGRELPLPQEVQRP